MLNNPVIIRIILDQIKHIVRYHIHGLFIDALCYTQSYYCLKNAQQHFIIIYKSVIFSKSQQRPF
eukprot:UN07678